MALDTVVVGAGNVSSVHAAGLDRCPYTTLSAVCDLDESRAREAVRAYDAEYYTDVEDAIATERPDLVIVCTPVQTHHDIAQTALEADVAVLVEKPATVTVSEWRSLVSTARERDVPISAVHNHLYVPAMRRALARIDGGELGDVRGAFLTFSGHTRPDEPKRGSWTFELPGGEFEEGLPHPIYLLLRAGGYPARREDVQVTTSLSRDYEQGFAYDGVELQYASEDGTLCVGAMLAGGTPQRLLHVVGENGALTVDFVSNTLLKLDGDYAASGFNRLRNNADRIAGRARGTVENVAAVGKAKMDDGWEVQKTRKPHFHQLDETAKAILSGTEPPVSTAEVEWTITLMERIREAARREDKPVLASDGGEP